MNYGICSENHSKIVELAALGCSGYKIAKILGCSKCSVLRYIHLKNISLKTKSKRDDDNLLKDKKETILKLYHQNVSQCEIAKIVGHSQPCVSKFLQSFGLRAKEWKYSVDESYFDKIDSEEKAYILGWFYSDGSVDEAGKMRIQILQTDSYILEWIKGQLKFDGELYQIPARNTSKPQTAICINRKNLADKLITLGCIPNKANVLQMPTFEQVPKEFFHHFLRGYFDGDGSISTDLRVVAVTSSPVFCESLARFLVTLGIESNTYVRKNSKMVFFTKNSEKLKFLNYIYKDATVFLKRKHEKYLQMLEKFS